MRRHEGTLYSTGYANAFLAAQKLLYSRHPMARIIEVKLIDTAEHKKTAPRLIFTNPKP